MFQVLACGAAIVTLSMGIRHGFGLWLQPITQEMGWTRENFSLAIAVQNLSWGILGIFVGMLDPLQGLLLQPAKGTSATEETMLAEPAELDEEF